MRGRWRPVLGAVGAAVAAVALGGGCQVDVSVGIRTGADGSGAVEVTALLDRRAAEAVGDLDSRLHVEDLREAGWEVGAPDVREDGSVAVVASRAFASPADAGDALADVGLGGFELEQRRGFFVTDTELTGNLDLRRGIESFGDADLAAAFGGEQPLGLSVAELERRVGAPVDQAFDLQIAARLPGRVEANAPTVSGGAAVWSPGLGEQVRIEASSRRVNVLNAALSAVAVASGAAAAVTGAVRATRQRRRLR